MNRDVDAGFGEREFDLAREDADDTEIGDRLGAVTVAGTLDGHDFDGAIGSRRAQRRRHPLGLQECQPTAARTDAQREVSAAWRRHAGSLARSRRRLRPVSRCCLRVRRPRARRPSAGVPVRRAPWRRAPASSDGAGAC